MKRTLYLSLFILLAVMLTASFYYIVIFGIVWNGLIPWWYLECFLDMSLSVPALSVIVLIGILIGYRAGQKWWQIIYVDGVYYFDKKLKPIETPDTPITPRRRRMQKSVKKTES